MTATTLPIGAPIAHGVRDSSELFTSNGGAPKTLRDLFDILRENPPKSLSMLHTAWSVLAGYLQTPADEITIDSVFENREGFPRYLESRKYKRNSVRSYANYECILLKKAEEFGWNPEESFPGAWRGVLALATEKKCADIARYVARIRKTPADVTAEDADSWAVVQVQQGGNYLYNKSKKMRFWRLLRDCGFTRQIPVSLLREKDYGIPLGQLPPDLNRELTALSQWKQAEYSHGRTKEERYRKTTARDLEQFTCSLIGYAINIRGEVGLTSLSQVVQEDIVGAYVEWCANTRKVKWGSLHQRLRLLTAAMRQHRDYKSLKWDWLKPFLDGLPVEPESDVQDRKAEKYVEYQVAETIPAKIHADRLVAEKMGTDQVALLVMEELMMRWLVTLPWRQLNIRECRISGPRPNLFKGTIQPYSAIDKPGWVREEESNNLAAEFWQFQFSSEETKMGNRVRAILPRQLIGILEEYLEHHRAHFLVGTDPSTLFVNGDGKAMSKNQTTCMVSTQTMRYCGRRVTPHLFRDIAAFAWLKEHPADYLTLSKMLWHRNIQTTIAKYGGRFNESSGVCAMEAWLDKRPT